MIVIMFMMLMMMMMMIVGERCLTTFHHFRFSTGWNILDTRWKTITMMIMIMIISTDERPPSWFWSQLPFLIFFSTAKRCGCASRSIKALIYLQMIFMPVLYIIMFFSKLQLWSLLFVYLLRSLCVSSRVAWANELLWHCCGGGMSEKLKSDQYQHTRA